MEACLRCAPGLRYNLGDITKFRYLYTHFSGSRNFYVIIGSLVPDTQNLKQVDVRLEWRGTHMCFGVAGTWVTDPEV